MSESAETPQNKSVDDQTLQLFLSDALTQTETARIEKLVRSSASLRDRLESLRQNQSDAAIHTLGAIWTRARLSCPDREQLGSYLIETLSSDHLDYIKFHLEVIGCPYCQANLTDLKGQLDPEPSTPQHRQRRYFESSYHLLSDHE